MNKEVARTSRQIQVFHQQNFIKLNTAQKMEFAIKDLFSKCEQIHSFLRICSHLIKESLMENNIFCAVKWAQENSKKGVIHFQKYIETWTMW